MSYPPGTLLLLSEAAKHKGVARSRMYQFVKSGRLPFVLGDDGLRRVRVEDVDAIKPLPPGRRKKG